MAREAPLSVRLPPELRVWVERYAVREGMSRTAVIVRALEDMQASADGSGMVRGAGGSSSRSVASAPGSRPSGVGVARGLSRVELMARRQENLNRGRGR